MQRANPDKLKVGQTIYYIPAHLTKTKENAEEGVIIKINAIGIYIRYGRSATPAMTPGYLLYVPKSTENNKGQS